MYCTIQDMRSILPERITIGDQNIGTPRPGRVATNRNTITIKQAKEYILLAQQYIDGRLRPFYVCPLRRIKSFETAILENVNPGIETVACVHDNNIFGIEQIVRIQNSTGYEETTVYSVDSSNTNHIVLSRILNTYDYSDSKISILEFPDPIPLLTARFACSFLIDRLFVAEQSPDVSQYGKNQRNLARNEMDDILAGTIRLVGQDHTGRRFVRGSLFDAYKSPAEIQKGAEKE